MMKIPMKMWYLISLGLIVLFVGCTLQASPDVTESPVVTPVLESPIEPEPEPEETERPSCLTQQEPVGNTVCGYVVDKQSGKPIVGRPVFLAQALFSDDNSIVVAALDRERAPQSVTDETGMFFVKDVPSDLYFLQIDEYPKPIMLKDPDRPQDDLIVDWRETDGAVDLGIIPASVVEP